MSPPIKETSWPTWCCGQPKYDNHEFRMRKRREVRAAMKALRDLYFGSAFTPASLDIDRAYEALKRAQQSLSVKNWGR